MGQKTEPQSNATNRISFGLVSHRTFTSITYSRLYSPFNNKQWRTGFGIGFGTGAYARKSFGQLGDNAIPIFGLIEYGTEHQIGLRLGHTYYFYFNKLSEPFVSLPGGEITTYSDYHAINSALYYRYNFGENQKYFLGLGAEFSIPFGEVRGQKNPYAPTILPSLSLGFQF